MTIEQNAECIARIKQARTEVEALGYRTYDTPGSLLPLAKPKCIADVKNYGAPYQLYVKLHRVSKAAVEALGAEHVVEFVGYSDAAAIYTNRTFTREIVDGGNGWWTPCSRPEADRLLELALWRKRFTVANDEVRGEVA